MNAATTAPVLKEIDLTDLSQWLTMEQIEAQNANFQVSSLRWLLRNRERNGLQDISKKVGKHWLIHSAGLSVWVSQRA